MQNNNSGEAMKILLVDDSLAERLVISAQLEEMGHQVVCGEDGQQGVALYLEQQPDLVLLDVNMPVMDGQTAARQMRSSSPEWVPIIFLSASARPGEVAAGIEAGGDDYLIKPVDPRVLSAKMMAMQRIAEMRHQLLRISAELEQANDELQRKADLDGLTGIANRRHLDRHLQAQAALCQRHKIPLSVIMLDLDHFKTYNDNYGHLAGDSCLKKVAKVMQRQVQRPTDLVGRYGGEEFSVILPDTDETGAQILAEKIRQSVSALAIPHENNSAAPHVTLSLGVATCVPEPGFNPADLVSRADKALYQAKQAGRNRVSQALS